MENISNTGWLIIGFIAILAFIIIMKKKPKINIGDKSIEFENLNTKIETVKQELSKNETILLDDKISQQRLYNEITEIDEKLKADHKRNIRELKLKMLKTPELNRNCQYAELITIQAIFDSFYDAVEYDKLKSSLTNEESKNYKKDLLYKIKQKYKTTLNTTANPYCPASTAKQWAEIEPLITGLIDEWEQLTIKAITNRIHQKIKTYKTYKGKFTSKYYKKIAIDKPLEKNYNYLNKLKRGTK